jgi:alkaline phosphatase
MRKIIALLSVLMSIGILLNAQEDTINNKVANGKKPKNVIFMIGDGMGLSQMYAALTSNGGQLNMMRFDQIAIVRTNSANDYITDSGAAGTALACGQKTNNGMIGMTPDSLPLESILKLAEKHGLATGMVISCDITHATPAAFMANVPSRRMAEKIALQFLDTDIDVFIGGGRDRFLHRKDNLNLLDSLKAYQYHVVETIPELSKINQGKLAALLYPAHPPKVSEGRADMLGIGTSKAMELLSKNPAGFFLMVEGSQIDWGGHDNSMEYVISETLDFDRTVGLALDFAEKNGETLVVVTADHETGGLSNLEGDFKEMRADGKFTTTDHSAEPVILYAYGPGAEHFKGIIENTDVFRLIKEQFGF